MTRIAAPEERAATEASAWLARLQRAELSEGDGLEFDAWLAAAPGNRAAYQNAVALWQEFSAGDEAIVAQLEAEARHASLRPSPTRRWLSAAAGFAVAAGLAIAILPSTFTPPAPQTYVTGKGQHQRLTLTDGSIVDLNAETRLSVHYSRSERRIVLGDGEAIFDVAHDQHRPFSVEAANRIVRDVGTQFDVRSRRGELVVTVAHGRVEVRPASPAASGRAFLLTPGQRLAIDRAGTEDLKFVDPQEALSWRAGRLVYREQPLSEVVADLNRQFVEQVEIGDPQLATTPITGVVVLDDPHAVIARLSLMLPIRSVPSERGLLLLRK